MFASSPSLHGVQDEEPSELMWLSGQDSQAVLSVFLFVPAGHDSEDGFVNLAEPASSPLCDLELFFWRLRSVGKISKIQFLFRIFPQFLE